MRSAGFIGLGIFLGILLVLRIFLAFTGLSHLSAGQQVQMTARLTGQIRVTDRFQQFGMTVGQDHVQVVVPRFPELSYGDNVQVSGTITTRSIGNKILFYLQFPKLVVLSDVSLPFAFARVVREHVALVFSSSLPPTSASLLLGIVFGIKQDMPKQFTDSLAKTGLTHVVAASGMNVTMVAGSLIFLFGLVLKRQIAIIAAVIGLLAYLTIAGFEPSLVRAAIMAGIAFGSQLLGRQQNGIWALLLTVWVMLMLDPMQLTDVGFQLSVLATAGILVIKPMLDQVLLLGKGKKGIGLFLETIGEDLSTTTAAQILTIPVILVVFSQYSLLSTVANLLVLWTVPILMVLGSVAVLVSFIEPFAHLILLLSLPLLKYFEAVVYFIASHGWQVQIQTIPWEFIASYYLLVCSLILFVKKR